MAKAIFYLRHYLGCSRDEIKSLNLQDIKRDLDIINLGLNSDKENEVEEETEIEKTKGLDTGHDDFIERLQKQGNAKEFLAKEFKNMEVIGYA